MNWFKLECTTRTFVTALQLTVRYEMSVIIIIIIIIRLVQAVTEDIIRAVRPQHSVNYFNCAK